jgi:hypothetical protein
MPEFEHAISIGKKLLTLRLRCGCWLSDLLLLRLRGSHRTIVVLYGACAKGALCDRLAVEHGTCVCAIHELHVFR